MWAATHQTALFFGTQLQAADVSSAFLHRQRALVSVRRYLRLGQLDHFHAGLDAQLIQELLQIVLHFNRVVGLLGYRVQTQLAAAPHLNARDASPSPPRSHLVLTQEVGDEY